MKKVLYMILVFLLPILLQAELFPTLQSEDEAVEKNLQQLDDDISVVWEYPFTKKVKIQEDGTPQRVFSSSIGSRTMIWISIVKNRNRSEVKNIVTECVNSGVEVADPKDIKIEYGTYENSVSATGSFDFILNGAAFNGTIQCALPNNQLLMTLVLSDQNSFYLHHKLLKNLRLNH
ncbi:MAG: hypothetical protein U9Q62_02100 [Campylobacterota bacterium]|nr:hypothetical protein [Campylobacterota bacterium]